VAGAATATALLATPLLAFAAPRTSPTPSDAADDATSAAAATSPLTGSAAATSPSTTTSTTATSASTTYARSTTTSSPTTSATTPGALATSSLIHIEGTDLGPSPPKARYFAAFLHSASRDALLESFPPAHATVVADHMTVSYDPRDDRLAAAAMNLKRPVDLEVVGIARDAWCEAALVRVVRATADDDGGLSVAVENEHAHVTLSLARADDPARSALYSNELLARVLGATGGEARDYDDGHGTTFLRLAHPFPLRATACVSDLWHRDADRCGEPRECGFCRFMKLGPCGAQFEAWEVCLDACKEADEDFVDKCSAHTLALKECVDANPLYYYSVSGAEEEAERE